MDDYERTRARLIHAAQGNLERSLALMRSQDPQHAEDGFELLRAMAVTHIAELLAEYRREEQPALRRWLLELIGLARSPSAFGLLAVELGSGDEAIRSLAVRGLRELDTKDARLLLWERGHRAT